MTIPISAINDFRVFIKTGRAFEKALESSLPMAEAVLEFLRSSQGEIEQLRGEVSQLQEAIALAQATVEGKQREAMHVQVEIDRLKEERTEVAAMGDEQRIWLVEHQRQQQDWENEQRSIKAQRFAVVEEEVITYRASLMAKFEQLHGSIEAEESRLMDLRAHVDAIRARLAEG